MDTNLKMTLMVIHFMGTNRLGSYNMDNFSITLYGIRNIPSVLDNLKNEIGSFGLPFRFVPLPGDNFINVNILDIGL